MCYLSFTTSTESVQHASKLPNTAPPRPHTFTPPTCTPTAKLLNIYSVDQRANRIPNKLYATAPPILPKTQHITVVRRLKIAPFHTTPPWHNLPFSTILTTQSTSVCSSSPLGERNDQGAIIYSDDSSAPLVTQAALLRINDVL